jgi:inosine/xanthosine triphosphatase
MKKVVIASENPVKIAVAKRAFEGVYPEETFEYIAIKSDSGVPEQPMNDETEQGAINRLNFVKEIYPEADYWISQEGGVYSEGDKLYNRAWIAVCDKLGNISKSSTPSFYLPKKIVEYISQGLELGDATDKFFSSINSKHGIGAVGYITDGLINREDYYSQSAIIAVSELKHQDWYD